MPIYNNNESVTIDFQRQHTLDCALPLRLRIDNVHNKLKRSWLGVWACKVSIYGILFQQDFEKVERERKPSLLFAPKPLWKFS